MADYGTQNLRVDGFAQKRPSGPCFMGKSLILWAK